MVKISFSHIIFKPEIVEDYPNLKPYQRVSLIEPCLVSEYSVEINDEAMYSDSDCETSIIL